MIEIHFSRYVENVKSFLSKKSQFELVQKIKINCTRASLFNFKKMGNKTFLCGFMHEEVVKKFLCRCESSDANQF